MQTTTSAFDDRANTKDLRPISWAARVAFDKIFTDDVDFFTIGESEIGGADVIKGEGDVVQEWDKYTYADYSDRIVSFEITKTEETPSSLSLAIADVVMENHDKFFNPDSGSAIDAYILPWRPWRLYAGFGRENLPLFVGLNDSMPTYDTSARTASFHCVDFLTTILNRQIDQAVILQDVFTDEVLDYVFQLVGLLPTQYVLDYGYNLIKFAYIESGTKLGDLVRQLMEAEMGRLYMDELGIIRFKNRQNYSDTPVMTFDRSNVIDYTPSTQTDIINTVNVTSDVREVQANQKYWELAQPVQINPGESVDVWANFQDPVTGVDTPVYVEPDATSLFSANTQEDGSGDVYTDIDLDSHSRFATSYLMTFTNSGSQTAYLRVIELWATPAKVIKTIDITQSDATSVAKYDEQSPQPIQNNFIQDETTANSIALVMIEDYKEYGSIVTLQVRSNPALQIGDAIDVDLDGIEGTYVITKTYNRYLGSKADQTLTARKVDIRHYFTIEVSDIQGTDEIAP